MVLAVLALPMAPGEPTAQPLRYPATRRDSVVDDYHGTQVADPYRWLEQLDSPGTADWVRAQTRLTESALGRIHDREPIRRRLTALWNYSRTEVPWREGGRLRKCYVRRADLANVRAACEARRQERRELVKSWDQWRQLVSVVREATP